MARTLAEVHQQLFKKEVDATYTLIKEVKPEKRMFQLKEGKSHALWLIGHIANTNNLLINRWCLEGESQFPKDLVPKFSPDFSGGIDPSADLEFYPSWDEVVDIYTAVSSACIEGIGGLSEDILFGPLRGGAPEAMQERFGNVDDIICAMTAHNAYHRGQIGMLNAQD